MSNINIYSFSKPKIILTTLFLAANITHFTIGPRLIHIFGLIEPGGILVFPLTFLFSDIITEVYGYKYARTLVWCALFMYSFFTFATWVSMFLPEAVVHFDYKQIFSLYPRGLFSVCIATFISFFINNTILSKTKIKLKGKLFWLRSIFSTSIGHLSFSVTWVFAFWIGRGIGSWNMFYLIGCMFLWKMSFEALATPFVAFTVSWLKRKEGDEVFDYDTKFNPFIL